MSSKWTRIALVGLSAVLLLAGTAFAQQAATDEGKRKVKTRVSPAYPDLARRMGVSGKVKIEVVISPDGRVRSTRLIGGHPLLVQPSIDALKEWKFMPAQEETTQIVEFDYRVRD